MVCATSQAEARLEQDCSALALVVQGVPQTAGGWGRESLQPYVH